MNHSGKLKVTLPSDTEIVMTRAFDAPAHLVWEAITTPALFRRWLYLPPGWEMTDCAEDLRVGGAFRWAWNDQTGKQAMVMHGVYQEVSPPGPGRKGGRVVRTETYDMGCDSQAATQLASIDLIEQGQRTHVTITCKYPSKEARDGALASGMEGGLGVGYDRLEVMLAERLANAAGRSN